MDSYYENHNDYKHRKKVDLDGLRYSALDDISYIENQNRNSAYPQEIQDGIN